MTSKIPESRLGRALKAGIPVALILCGAELLDGVLKVERSDQGLALTWMATREPLVMTGQPPVRLTTCFGEGCGRWTLAVSLPDYHFGADVTSFARAMVSVVTGGCPEERRRSRAIAMA